MWLPTIFALYGRLEPPVDLVMVKIDFVPATALRLSEGNDMVEKIPRSVIYARRTSEITNGDHKRTEN